MAADSYSARLRLRMQATGGNPNTWGSLLNAAALQLVEDAICGMANITVANGAVTLSANNGAQDQARMAILNLTGAPTSGQNVVVPQGITKLYLIVNGTGQTMTATTLVTGSATVAVPTGQNLYVYTDGTNVYAVGATLFGAAPNASALGGVAAANFPQLNAVNQFLAALAVKFSTLTDGATITLNANLSNHFLVTLAGNRTLAITNPTDGQEIEIWIQQDSTGGRTLAWPSNVKFESGGTGALSTAANSLDRYCLTYNATLNTYIARAGLSQSPAGVVGVTSSVNECNVNLFLKAGSPSSAVTVNYTVAAGVTIFSTDTGTPAIDCTGFPAGSTINIVNLGYILGRGGHGGQGGEGGHYGGSNTSMLGGRPGFIGGDAIKGPGSGVTLNITNGSGFIWGGGGGGGGGGVTWNIYNVGGTAYESANGGGGGGGAGGGQGGQGGADNAVNGFVASNGASGSTGKNGTFGAGGAGNGSSGSTVGTGGAGGDWGSAGASGQSVGGAAPGGTGGGPGKAVNLNGGSANFTSGSGAPNVKGSVS